MLEIIVEIQVRDGKRQNETVFLELDGMGISPVEDVKFIYHRNGALLTLNRA